MALALSIAALGGAALRLASLAAPHGLARVIAAAVLATAAAGLETLALGLLGLGASPLALTLAAAATWLAAFRFLPAYETELRHEATAWWRRLGAPARLVAGGLLAAGAYWLVWMLWHPGIGFDSSIYHYPEVAIWISDGHPGSVHALSYDLPYGDLPLTDEVLRTWSAAIARSFVPMALWTPATFVLLGVSGWAAMKELRAPRLAGVLAVVAVLALPTVVKQLNEPQTDLPALAWLVAACALALASRERPAVLVPALVAAALAVGTRTQTLIPAVVVMGVAIYHARGHLRPLARPLAAASLAAVFLGAFWYLRDLVDHGSPFWPFVRGPGGDPVPRILELASHRFIRHPLATLDGRVQQYAALIAGGLALLFGGILAPLVARSRQVLGIAALTAVGFLAWAVAPTTGVADPGAVSPVDGYSTSTTRYLLPVFALGAAALALAARDRGWGGRLATFVLGGAAVWSLVTDAGIGFDLVPPLGYLGLAALAGTALVLLALRLPARASLRVPEWPPAAALVAGVAIVLGLASATFATGYVRRHASTARTTVIGGTSLIRWFASNHNFVHGHAPIALASRGLVGGLAGDRFQHRLELIPAHEPCPAVRARASRGWVVTTDVVYGQMWLGVNSFDAPACLAKEKPIFNNGVYRVYRLSAAGGAAP